MPLNDILNADIIDLNVEGNSKDEVLHYMANVLLKNGYINDVDVFVFRRFWGGCPLKKYSVRRVRLFLFALMFVGVFFVKEFMSCCNDN